MIYSILCFLAWGIADLFYKKSNDNKDKYDEYDIDIVDSDLDEELNNSIKSYAQGIYDADKQLGRLYDYIQTLDEDTIIVFYGDHLPYIKADGKDVLTELEFFNTDDDKLNLYRKYNTQALVLSNFNMDTLKEENKTVLLFDLDNTIINNRVKDVTDKEIALFRDLDKKGFRVFIVSNSFPWRVKKICNRLSIMGFGLACKPLTFNVSRIMNKYKMNKIKF